MNKKAVFYGVRVGRKPGVYTSWKGCQTNVEGFSGAEFKKFKNESEAAEFVRCYTPTKNENTKESTTTNQNESHDEKNQSNASTSKSQLNIKVRVTIKASNPAHPNTLWYWEAIIPNFTGHIETCKINGLEGGKHRANLRAIMLVSKFLPDKEARLHFDIVNEGNNLKKWEQVFMIEQVEDEFPFPESGKDLIENCKEEMGKFTHPPSLGKCAHEPDLSEVMKTLFLM